MSEQTPYSGDRRTAGELAPEASTWLAQLLREHGGRVAGHLGRRFPALSQEERYDVMVDALLVFIRTYDRERGPTGPWLLLLAHQRAIDFLRQDPLRRPPLEWIPEQVASLELSPAKNVEQQERVDEIHRAIAKLSPLEQTIIEADLEVGGKANARRLAAQLETTERAVYAARARAREKLAAWLL